MAKQTKIVATIGPASQDKKILREMILAGMDVARINFSHGDHNSNGELIKTIKELRAELQKPVGILVDLQGPRIRTLVESDTGIKEGEVVIISDISKKYQAVSSKQQAVCLDWPGIIGSIKIGDEILIQDGLIKLKVVKKEKEFLEAEVINGGTVKNHKGVNIPDAELQIGALTSKDEADLKFVLEQEIDFIGLSFVSTAEDIEELRAKIRKILKRDDRLPQIVAKIERKKALDNLKEIIKATDAVMVARGDLGIEVEESRVAILQKEIIAESLKNVKPVIVATQMLMSMVNSPLPTRAEVSDVTNAVIDHADAVMLSDETAGGKYPVESVKAMREIIEETEKSPFDDVAGALEIENPSEYAEVIKGAFEIAKSSQIKALLTVSRSGLTARLLSHFRLQKPTLVAANNPETFNQLALVWGVKSYLIDSEKNIDDFINQLADRGKEEKILEAGDKVVVILGKGPNNEKMRLIGVKEIS